MRNQNRILSLNELLALPTGESVYVETSQSSEYKSCASFRGILPLSGDALVDESGGYFPITGEWVGSEYRVWLRCPTDEEQAATPWEH